MNLVILGGFSDYNKTWVEQVQESLADLFESAEILYYKHWEPYDEFADVKPEVENLKALCENKPDLVVFGKAAGAALALQAVRNGYIQPMTCIFPGLAYNWSKEQGWMMDELLRGFNIPSLFIQQSRDLATPFQEVKNILTTLGVKNYELKELEGDDHKYEDTSLIRSVVEEFVKVPIPA